MESTFNSGEYITPQKRPRKKPETPVRKWTAEERDKLCELKRDHGDLTIDEFHRAFDSYFPGRSSGAIHQEWLHLKKDPSRQLYLTTNTSDGGRLRRSKIVILKMNKRHLSSSTGPVDFPSKEPRLDRQSSPESSDDDDGDVEFNGERQRFQTSPSRSSSVPRPQRATITPTAAAQPHPAQQNTQSQASVSAASLQWNQSGPMDLGVNPVPQTHLNHLPGGQIPQPCQSQKSGTTQPLPQSYTAGSAGQGPNHLPHTGSGRTFVNTGVEEYDQSTVSKGANRVPSGQSNYNARDRPMASNDVSANEVPKPTPTMPCSSSQRSEAPPNIALQPKPHQTAEQNMPATTAQWQPQAPPYMAHLTEMQCLQLIPQLWINLTKFWSERDQAYVKQCIANETLGRDLEALQSRILDMEKEMEEMKRERASEKQVIARFESFLERFSGFAAFVKHEQTDDNAK